MDANHTAIRLHMVTFCKTFLFLQHYRRSIGPNQEYENNFKRYIKDHTVDPNNRFQLK